MSYMKQLLEDGVVNGITIAEVELASEFDMSDIMLPDVEPVEYEVVGVKTGGVTGEKLAAILTGALETPITAKDFTGHIDKMARDYYGGDYDKDYAAHEAHLKEELEMAKEDVTMYEARIRNSMLPSNYQGELKEKLQKARYKVRRLRIALRLAEETHANIRKEMRRNNK